MINENAYGAVYTPQALSDFVATVLLDEFIADMPTSISNGIVIVDPACGEAALLEAARKSATDKIPDHSVKFIGVDVEMSAIKKDSRTYKGDSSFEFYNFDSIIPNSESNAVSFWNKKIPDISMIIANPPWSSEKIYAKDDLEKAGYNFENGQYDNYVLFIELCLNIIKPDGYCAFILPDSIFASENRMLRKYMSEHTKICVIARLGEKLFPGVNRATSVMIVKKAIPEKNSNIKCFRLNTNQRKEFLNGTADLYTVYLNSLHLVSQRRFQTNQNYTFDIDTRLDEEELLRKIENGSICWSNIFHFGRGVEISKLGAIVTCLECGRAQVFSKKQRENREKTCRYCGAAIEITLETIKKIIVDTPQAQYKKIFVGENIRRYAQTGVKYIKMDVNGINYKEPKLYEPPKILIRKTGLGINAYLDYTSTYMSQTVYSCNYLDVANPIPLEYYLGVLNSRLMFYYYLKIYGENEWKSHPYITKDILFSLPIKEVTVANRNLCLQIANMAKELIQKYSREVDMDLENLVMQLYGIDKAELSMIVTELENLPDLSAINHMKF